MELNVLYFAHVRARVGVASERLCCPADVRTAGDVMGLLVQRYPSLEALVPSLRIAMDGAFVSVDEPIHDGAEFVLIPPVSGGSAPHSLAELTEAPIDSAQVQRLSDHVSDPGYGAIVSFTGMVRDHARGRAVTHLDYEAYGPMATRVLRAILEEVEAACPGVRCAVIHRTGQLVVGDVAVCVVAASAHRGPAFEACRLLLDRLKEDVPIWKRECGPDGESWVSDRP